MITKEATYRQAFENKEKRVKAREREREILLSAAYTSYPRLEQIEREQSSVGATLALSTLSGDKDKLGELKKKSQALSAEKMLILEKAQVPSIDYECQLCGDTGYTAGKICECIKKEAAAVMARELSREMPLGECGFESFDLKYYPEKLPDGKTPRKRITAILKVCREYAINFNAETSRNLLFTGETGLGKTHLTLAIASEVIKKGFLPIYGSAENLFSAIEAEKFSGEGRGCYNAILNADLLVIDDLGVEMATALTKSVLYNIVNTRILSGRPTIINTNLSMKEIENRYTARITSRFIGSYDEYRFIGTDIRLQKKLEGSEGI